MPSIAEEASAPLDLTGKWWTPGGPLQLRQHGSSVTGNLSFTGSEQEWTITVKLTSPHLLDGQYRKKIPTKVSDKEIDPPIEEVGRIWMRVSPKGRWLTGCVQNRVASVEGDLPFAATRDVVSGTKPRDFELGVWRHGAKPYPIDYQGCGVDPWNFSEVFHGAIVEVRTLAGERYALEKVDELGFVIFPELPYAGYTIRAYLPEDTGQGFGGEKIKLGEMRYIHRKRPGVPGFPTRILLNFPIRSKVVAKATAPPPPTPAPASEPCPPKEHVERAHYRLTNAEAYARDARGFRKQAAILRQRAADWRQLAQSPRIRDDTILFREYEEKAYGLDQQAEQYEQRAAEAEQTAAEERRLGEEAMRRLARPNRPDCEVPRLRRSNVAINVPPPPVSSAPAPQNFVCGPDVTQYVLGALRKLYLRRWANWGLVARFLKCEQLLDFRTAEDAWDISALAPGIAPDPQDKYESSPASRPYAEYLANDFWFEMVSPLCAIPRPPCGPTVTFLGQCIHSQQVNYIQWGFMNRLCGQEIPAAALHRLRNVMASARTHDAQLVMAAVGARYATDLDAMATANAVSVPTLRINARAELRRQISRPEHSRFRDRVETACSTTCRLNGEQEDGLRKGAWTAMWGSP